MRKSEGAQRPRAPQPLAMQELQRKLASVRARMRTAGIAAVRFRGTEWFAWATCGGSNVVLLTTDVGVAEVVVTVDRAYVLTDQIEAERLRAEELPRELEVLACPWTERPAAWDKAVRDCAEGGEIASDRPAHSEMQLPAGLLEVRWSLGPEEVERYRGLGRDAADAMTDVLQAARPEWTGRELAGAGAEALWARGIEPALTLVGGERRVSVYRHATAKDEKLGARAMLVFCARRHGLFANLTRFVYFRRPTPAELRARDAVAAVEAEAFRASRPGTALAAVYDAIVAAYAAAGYPGEEDRHHQGGPTGYLAREAIASPRNSAIIGPDTALAWNPSVPGVKIEDTVVCGAA